MPKAPRSIEIVYTSVKEFSSMSLPSREALAEVLRFHYADVRLTDLRDVADLEQLADRKPDLVFLTVKFVSKDRGLGMDDPDKVWVPDFLDRHGIAYTGSARAAHELELHKQLAKKRVLDAGLDTAAFTVVPQDRPCMPDDLALRYPVFIKPTDRGGGAGVDASSLAATREEADAKLRELVREERSDALVEEYLPGREFSVAILKKETGDGYLVMPIELGSEPGQEGDIMSNEMKLANAEVILEVSDPRLRETVCAFALDVFHALGARDYGRIDLRMDAADQPHFLEANLFPSLIEGYGSFPKAALLNEEMDYEEMVLRIVCLGFARAA